MSLPKLIEGVRELDKLVLAEEQSCPELRTHRGFKGPGFKEVREHLADAKACLLLMNVTMSPRLEKPLVAPKLCAICNAEISWSGQFWVHNGPANHPATP